MSILSKHLTRYGLALLSIAAAVGCGIADPDPDSGSLSLSISTNGATVLQGGLQAMTARLTRMGGFSGTVSFTITGAPSGVTATVSNLQTAGTVTTATVTILVGASVAPEVYPLLVHATGNGVTEVTQPFTLTVSQNLGFSISLSATALSIVQGASTPTTTVNITRVSHLGEVALYLTGLPSGVTASFDPADWPADDNTVLTLTVAAVALPGSYSLRVYAHDPEREGEISEPLTLTITAPPPVPGYSLTLSNLALTIPQSAWSQPTTVVLSRTEFTGYVALSVDNLPTGVSAYFQPLTSIPGSPQGMYLFVAGDAVPGDYGNLVVRGVATGLADRTAPLTLRITVAPFSITLSESALSVAQGASATTTVHVVRNSFSGAVPLYVWGEEDEDGAIPPGVTAAFSPNPATGDSSVLTVGVTAATKPGVYNIRVYGDAPVGWFERLLTLTVTAAP